MAKADPLPAPHPALSAAAFAATAAVSVLEASPLTNAGVGSCLNEDGDVECDATVGASTPGAGRSSVGAVVALRGVERPVEVAHLVATEAVRNKRPLGLVSPSVLCGEGAAAFAAHHGVPIRPKSDMATPERVAKYHEYVDAANADLRRSAASPPAAKRARVNAGGKAEEEEEEKEEEEEEAEPPQHGTVGAVCVDLHGTVACATSSGGLWLKPAGRVGVAGLPGAGSFSAARAHFAAACVVSGCGESMLPYAIPARCVDAAIQGLVPGLADVMLRSLTLMEERRRTHRAPGVGILMVRGNSNGSRYEVAYAHNTEDMAVGCLSSDGKFRSKVSSTRGAGSTSAGGWGCSFTPSCGTHSPTSPPPACESWYCTSPKSPPT